jgi:hypothetical protein
MKSFIEKTVVKIFDTHKESLGEVMVVFPSRRAGLYFKKSLSGMIEKPVWSPTVLSLNDFIAKHSSYNLGDNLTLTFELYKSYKKYFADETFDEFYSWGEMLLKDFDEIDKYMVDARLIFKHIKDEKEIEATFPAEIREDAKAFWDSLLNIKTENKYKDNFLKIWDRLFDIYTDFKASLIVQGMAYEGLAIRDIADKINNEEFFKGYTKIYFAGFNSINKCELTIFKALKDKGLAEILWDADEYYLNDERQEAGAFIRRNMRMLGGEVIKSDESLLNTEKNINVIGSPLNAGMVKTFGNELSKFMKDNKAMPEKTLVLLPDSNTLLPALYALPEEANEINVSMGLPLKTTPLYNFINIVHKLQINKINEKGILKFYHKDVLRLMMHPYIKFASVKEIFQLANNIRKENVVYVNVSYALIDRLPEGYSKQLLQSIFSPVSEVDEIIKYLNDIINLLAVRIEKSNDAEANYKMFQLEYLYNFSTQLNRLTDAMEIDGIEMNQITFWNMLMQILNNASVVLTGEPLKGLQVMGLLETRNLDFENVFILSMNEAKMPKGAANLSYIPYSLRKAFGLPTFEDNDNITAYYFYSLIQKAKNVYLFYDTEVGNEVKEKSRYILQIENELAEKNPNIKYAAKIVSPTVKASNDTLIEVQKDEKLVEFMLKDIKRISPSDVINYIGCSLKFYLKKVLRLEAGDEVEEVFSAGTFGTVFHGVMQELYTPYEGKDVNSKTIDGLIEVVDNKFDEVFDKFIQSSDELKSLNFKEKGRNVLYKSVIQKLVRRLLLEEKKRGDFHISGLEAWVEEKIPVTIMGKECEIKVGGKIDRVDDVKGTKIVLDYKTGDAGVKKFDSKNPDEFWKEMFSDTKLKANLQTLFYSYLLYLRDGGEAYQAGIYPLKEIRDGIKYMRVEPFKKAELEIFGKGVRKVVEEMYDPTKTFVQTDDEKNCEYCDFKSLCRR